MTNETAKLCIGMPVACTFQVRGGTVETTGKVVSFASGGVEVTFDAPVMYAPGMPRDGAWYTRHEKFMVRPA